MPERGYRPKCSMVPCEQQGTKKIRAFGNPRSRWWCDDHAELAQINADTEKEANADD